jgi:hypothetical protein
MKGWRAIPEQHYGLRLGMLILVLGSGQRVYAQVDAGAVDGTVTDPSGGVVAGAKVTLTNEATSVSSETVTGAGGTYVFRPVKVGTYSVKCEANGFNTVTNVHVKVDIQQHVIVDFNLTVGSVATSVQVTGATPLLQVRDASVGQVVSTRQINDLPLNGRNYTLLAQLVPGVTFMQEDDRGLGLSGSFTANGTGWADSNYMLDGIDDNNTQVDNVSGTSFAVRPPVDAIQEFKVQTSNYSAELGRAAGAVLNATLKSGTNDYHGDVWEFLRNDKFDAADFFENAGNLKKGEYRQNQFGVTLGGPLSIPKVYSGKGRTFFFGDYEGTRINQALPQVSTVPTADERGSGYSNLSDIITFQSGSTPADLLGRTFPVGQVFDPATTRPVTQGQVDPVTGKVATATGYVRDPFPGNIIPPNRLDQVAIGLLNLYPAPTSPGLFNNYVTNPVLHHDTDSYDARIDQVIGQKDQTFVRFSYNNSRISVPSALPGVASGPIVALGNTGGSVATSAEWSETHSFSPTTVNEFRIAFTRIATSFQQFYNDTLGIPEQYGIPGVTQQLGYGGLPQFYVGGLQMLGAPGFLPTFKYSNVWDIRDDLTKIRGPHALKFGFETQYNFIPFLIPPAWRGDFDFSGEFTSIPGANVGSNGIAQFLLTPEPATVPNGINNVGGADSVGASNSVNTTAIRKYYAGYVQDDWKVNARLTLNLGLRYEWFSPYENRYDAQAMFIPGAPFAGARYLYPVSRETNPALPASFLQTLQKDGIALQYTNNVSGYSSLDNFAPRFGAAYQVNPKLVVRGGYGIFYGGFVNSSGGDHLGTNNFPFLFNLSYPAPDPAHPITPNNSIGLLQNGLLYVPVSPGAVTPSIGFNSIGRQFYYPTAYTQAANVSVQYQLTPNQSVQAAYVGTFGRHLQIAPGANWVSELLPPTTNFFNYIPFPDFAPEFTYATFEANSGYNSLQLSFERRSSSGLVFLANYTYSKCRTDARDLLEDTLNGYRAPYLPGFGIQGDYSLCAQDVRNILHFSGSYELPIGSGKKYLANSGSLVNNLVGGWMINWILTLLDGQPFTVPCNITTAAGLGCNALLVPGENVIGGSHNVNQWMNPAAFTNPAVVATIGQTGYGPLGGAPAQVVGPGFHRLDFSLFKQFRTSESTNLEFRFEFFNIFNTPNFANPTNVNFSSPAFGSITSTRDTPNDPRQIQFALKFYW